MKYSKNWLYIDILNLLTFLPLLFILPIFMQIYFAIALFVILDNKRWHKLLLFGGVVLVLISFISNFNLVEAPKFITFIKLLVSLLLVAVASQRALEEKNIYISLAPYLFFGFSIIFFQNLYMLFYSIFLIAVFLFFRLIFILEDFNIALTKFVKLFLVSIPIVIVLFLLFPRFHAKSPKIGFKSNYVLSGFGEVLSVSDRSVISSGNIVMELEFNQIPKELYFRGVVLEKNIANRWVKQNSYDIVTNGSNIITYTLKQYPTNKRYIFGLDMPIKAPKNTYLTNQHTLMSQKPLKEIINLKLSSFQNYKLKPSKISKTLLEFDKNKNLNTQKLLKDIKEIKNNEEKLNALKNLFITQKIKYTKSPPKFDKLNSVDEFFKLKKGYCVHFASAFATSARMVGLPSRVISGFFSSKNNLLNNYLVVKESDAHAWTEIYLKNKGWVRVDPTLFASEILSNSNANEVTQEQINPFKLYSMYLRFKIEQWVLYYDSYKQEKLKKLLEKRDFLIKFILVFVVLILLIITSILWLKREKISIEDKIVERLLKDKPNNMTTHSYLKSFNNPKINKISNLYHKIKYYKSSKKDIKELKKLVKEIKSNKNSKLIKIKRFKVGIFSNILSKKAQT